MSLAPYFEAFASGGDDGNRTHDPLLAGQVLSQLSYTPILGTCGPSKSNNRRSKYGSRQSWVYLFELRNRVYILCKPFHVLHRKEVIQPHLPIRLPCYDLTPITDPTFGSCPLAVSSLTSGITNFHGLTGGVYKARERIHRDMLIRDY